MSHARSAIELRSNEFRCGALRMSFHPFNPVFSQPGVQVWRVRLAMSRLPGEPLAWHPERHWHLAMQCAVPIVPVVVVVLLLLLLVLVVLVLLAVLSLH